MEKVETNDLEQIENKHKEILADYNFLYEIVSLENSYGRNNMCYCDSGVKFKKCCLKEHEEKEVKLSDLMDSLNDLGRDYSKLVKESKIEKNSITK